MPPGGTSSAHTAGPVTERLTRAASEHLWLPRRIRRAPGSAAALPGNKHKPRCAGLEVQASLPFPNFLIDLIEKNQLYVMNFIVFSYLFPNLTVAT
ncbi:unnamed protein product [Rangifer tarandus platyrhynchus]|uniref:Uncharacterized protein n=1 Tax=Rangifer tarandus platyrhynchus TaxID=3082113 RepID=A0AC59Y8H0_RANTA